MDTVYPLKTLSQLRPMLAGFRKANGLTQKEVAQKLGVTQQSYARMEANPGSASVERLFKVFTVLGVEMAFYAMPNISTSTIRSATPLRAQEEPCQPYSPARLEKW